MAEPVSEREEIARRIRQLRKLKEISIQTLAATAGISPGYLSEVERGLSAISGEKLVRIAAALDVTTDYLLSGAPEPSRSNSIEIPPGLAQAAEALNLTYTQTVRLLAGKSSLVARRGGHEVEWGKDEWSDFYQKVKNYL